MKVSIECFPIKCDKLNIYGFAYMNKLGNRSTLSLHCCYKSTFAEHMQTNYHHHRRHHIEFVYDTLGIWKLDVICLMTDDPLIAQKRPACD